jgi:hypothetical protein
MDKVTLMTEAHRAAFAALGFTDKPDPDVRYSAKWIVKQHTNEFGEWDPDRDEYVGSDHTTLEAAIAAAVMGSKKADVVEWWRVTQERFNAEVGIPRRHPAAWDTARIWHGDWEGNWDEDRS